MPKRTYMQVDRFGHCRTGSDRTAFVAVFVTQGGESDGRKHRHAPKACRLVGRLAWATEIGRRATLWAARKDVVMSQNNNDQMLGLLRDTIVAMVRKDGPDLSARQLGVFLTCYLQEGAHTVRGLAAELNVSKPAITRALDRLGELDLARRKVDPLDRRSVLVQRTLRGAAFLREMRSVMNEAAGVKAPKAKTAPVARIATRRAAG